MDAMSNADDACSLPPASIGPSPSIPCNVFADSILRTSTSLGSTHMIPLEEGGTSTVNLSLRSLESNLQHVPPVPAETVTSMEFVHKERTQLARSETEPAPMLGPPQQQQAGLEAATPSLQDTRRAIREPQCRERRSDSNRTAARKAFPLLMWKLLFHLSQLVVSIVLLSYAGKKKSPLDDTISQWRACREPLGSMCAAWCGCAFLGCLVAVWEYQKQTHRAAENIRGIHHPAANHSASHGENSDGRSRGTRSSPLPEDSQANWKVTLARSISLFSISWFLVAQVLLYTSGYACLKSAPYIWWLTFAIVLLGYFVHAKFIFCVLAFPCIFLVYVCTGRNPLRRSTHIRPEVRKLPQKVVDSIPLVLYIPAPNPKESASAAVCTQKAQVPHVTHSLDTPVLPLAVPKPAHVHSHSATERHAISPSTLAASSSAQRSRRLFTFRRIRPRKSAQGKEKPSSITGPGDHGESYEEKWERGEYPFVKLENNRAACAICLCDFEEPRRVRYSVDSKPAQDLDRAEQGTCESSTKSQNDGLLRPTEGGKEAQPLRLLACAHVFHKSCVDPWLTEVSGRCPVCQRPVELDDYHSTKSMEDV